MSDTVYAIVSIYDNAELLPHFLSHYSELGVNRILVVVRSATRGELYDAAVAEAVRYPASVYWFPATVFSDSDKADVEQRVLQANAVQPDDYVMHLDLDEFQEYPAPLPVIVREMNAYNDWALRGWIVDRVAEDGRLRAISRTPSIGEQYPMGCAATERLLNAWTQKIVLCRGRVRLQGGVRHDTENARYDRVPIGTPDQYVVHHFKWLLGLDRRLAQRLADGSIGGKYAAECREFLDYHRHHGRIDLSDTRLRPRRLGAIPIPGFAIRPVLSH
jgi:glycosyl transferase family 2